MVLGESRSTDISYYLSGHTWVKLPNGLSYGHTPSWSCSNPIILKFYLVFVDIFLDCETKVSYYRDKIISQDNS